METISPQQLDALARAGALQQIEAIAEGGDFILVVTVGMERKSVATSRGHTRMWRLETLAKRVHDLGIGKFAVDLTRWEPGQRSL